MWTELREHRTDTLELTDAEARALARVLPAARVSPEPTDHHWEVTPGSTVGVLVLGDKTLLVRPKIPMSRLMFMLAYTLDPVRWQDSFVGLERADNPLEVLVESFLNQLGAALGPGVLQGYRTVEDSLSVVKGRVRLGEQIRRHYGRVPPVAVSFDEFTTDIDENRLLRAAVRRVSRFPVLTDAQRSALHHHDQLLSEVSLLEYDVSDLPDIQWTRLNQRYRGAVALAELILSRVAFEQDSGEVAVSSFLVDMNVVFEDFVVAALRNELRPRNRRLVQGARGRSLSLDSSGRVRLEPDLSIWDGNRCVFVGDCKYKRVNVSGIKHPDLYQLLAYAVAADLAAGLLVYAAGEADPVVHEIPLAGKHLHVVSLDLSGPPGQLLMQVRGLRALIERLIPGTASSAVDSEDRLELA